MKFYQNIFYLYTESRFTVFTPVRARGLINDSRGKQLANIFCAELFLAHTHKKYVAFKFVSGRKEVSDKYFLCLLCFQSIKMFLKIVDICDRIRNDFKKTTSTMCRYKFTAISSSL